MTDIIVGKVNAAQTKKGSIDLNLGQLAPEDQLWIDSDGDGYPDQLQVRLCVASNLQDGNMWAAIGNLSARLSMQVTSVAGPIASLSRGTPSTCNVVGRPRKQQPQAALLETHNSCSWRLRGNSAKAMARVLESLSLAPIHPTEKYPERIVVPSPINPPDGCTFNPRCPEVRERCRIECPEFRELSPGRWIACHFR